MKSGLLQSKQRITAHILRVHQLTNVGFNKSECMQAHISLLQFSILLILSRVTRDRTLSQSALGMRQGPLLRGRQDMSEMV